MTTLLSPPQLTDLVRAAPMPYYVKEQILDAALGYHDGLYAGQSGPKTPNAKTPGSHRKPDPKPGAASKEPGAASKTLTKAERVAEARKIGGFVFRETLPSGDAVYRYHKDGVGAYDLTVRGDDPVHCACRDFEIQVHGDPDYRCKHCLLFLQQEVADVLIFACAQEAAAWETAWAWHKLGRLTDAECSAAYARFERARDEMRKVVAP